MPSRIDEFVSEGTGKVKGATARSLGLVGVFKTLVEQHGEAGALLERIQADPDKRDDLWPKTRLALLSHEHGELERLYPELARYTETRALADHHQREAGELERTIDKLDDLDLHSDSWTEVFDALVLMVGKHVDEEEKQIFPKAQEVIGEDRARALQPMFLAAQEQARHAA